MTREEAMDAAKVQIPDYPPIDVPQRRWVIADLLMAIDKQNRSLTPPPKPGYAKGMAQLQERVMMDWTDCPLVETVPGKVSGVPILKGTRVQADSIVENYEGGSPVAEISENFAIPEAAIRAVLDYAAKRQRRSQP